MDNALIADGAIILILLLGTLRGAKRGLVGSLMGIFVVIGALLGSLTLVDMLTDPITDRLSARIEEEVVQSVSVELKRIVEDSSEKGAEALTALAEKYDIPSELLDDLLFHADEIVRGAETFTSRLAMERFEDAASAGVRAIVRKAVQTALTVICFLALLIVLGLVGKAVDKVFDLPLLNATNTVGGAILGLLGAGAAIYALLYLASRFHLTAILKYADGSRLMPFFLPRSTVGLSTILYG